jgi:hypothetical protein
VQLNVSSGISREHKRSGFVTVARLTGTSRCSFTRPTETVRVGRVKRSVPVKELKTRVSMYVGRVKRSVPVNGAETIMPGNNLLYIQEENNSYAL